MKKYKDYIIYGTLRECVDELWKMIDFKNGVFPDFDFAASVCENEDNACDAYDSGECWFGCKDIGKAFDCDTISLMIAHYGGGGITSMELTGEYPDEKETLMRRIAEATDLCGCGVLEPYDFTVFEISKRNCNS